ncbi:MAG: hypothetical protein Q9O24_04145 [Gammaproteobacteria bacterium]|nr:hypothetical protein [Gammaproteobacteria bacterium]
MKLSLSVVTGLFFSSWLLMVAPVSAEHHMSPANPCSTNKMEHKNPCNLGATKKKCDHSADTMKKMDHDKMGHGKMEHHKMDAEHKNCDMKKDHKHKNDHHHNPDMMKKMHNPCNPDAMKP